MSMCKAALLNLTSATTSLIGVFVGVALGGSEETSKWLLALTAGMFIYIALVDMVGVCIESSPIHTWCKHVTLWDTHFDDVSNSSPSFIFLSSQNLSDAGINGSQAAGQMVDILPPAEHRLPPRTGYNAHHCCVRGSADTHGVAPLAPSASVYQSTSAWSMLFPSSIIFSYYPTE